MHDIIKSAFLNPLKEYTPIPFWFWNDRLTEDEIKRQINDFNEKGVNGFVIHPRIGIPEEIEYLSDRFMELVSCAVSEADKLGMKVVLYDEAMYPSGSAHGMVVKKNPDYASKALMMKEIPCTGNMKFRLEKSDMDQLVSVQAVKKLSDHQILPESIRKLAVVQQEIEFVTEDDGDWSILLFLQTFTKGHIRGIHFGEDDEELNAPASTDLLKKEAIEEFISITHERYYEVLGDYFGNTVLGMFTDEPCIMGRGNMEGLKPWTDHFLEYYLSKGNAETDLPYLWYKAGEETEIKRRNYEETVNKRMEESYYKPIYEWCEEHKIALTGHPEKSDDIGLLKYFHIPAQDLVWRWVAPEKNLALEGLNSTMAKCSSDSARHRGRRRNGNECFGCCGKDQIEWSFTADDMKWYMDWLFVRGVNLLYPHAFYYSIEGERRVGERPPDVGPNNIWWENYNLISDYIKRMSYLMTDSTNLAQVAVLCGANELPWRMVKPLYENQIEFNYLEKELLESEKCILEGSSIRIANQGYKVLLIEDIHLLDENNMPKIQQFIDQGGSVLLYNPMQKSLKLEQVDQIHDFSDLLELMSQRLEKDVIPDKVVRGLRYTHMKKAGYEFYVFVNEGEEDINTLMQLKAKGKLELWDAWNGSIEYINEWNIIENNYMEVTLHIPRRESRIIFINKDELSRDKLVQDVEIKDRVLQDKKSMDKIRKDIGLKDIGLKDIRLKDIGLKDTGLKDKEIKNKEIKNRDLEDTVLRARVLQEKEFIITESKDENTIVGAAKDKYHPVSLYHSTPERLEGKAEWYMGPDVHNLNRITTFLPWDEIKGLEHFSGTMVYKSRFYIEAYEEKKKVELDLGEVHEIAQVSLNGIKVGVKMWAPYLYDLTDNLIEGWNELEIEVKNTVANRINNLNLKSGLLGPVSLKI